MDEATCRTVVVCGATGKQGSAVVEALMQSPSNWRIKALTRNPASVGARALAERGVDLVLGDMDRPDTLKQAFDGAYGVFSVQPNALTDEGREVRCGRNVTEAAQSAGVSHLIYSSVGGAERHSGVPHFEAKRQIELHVLESGVPATILRPASFMDNFASLAMRITLLSMFRTRMSSATKLQLIATRDIGRFAVRALERPDAHIGAQLELAGDSLTVDQIVTTLRSGRVRPTFALRLPSWVVRKLPEDFPVMVDWFEREGFAADIDHLRSEMPDLQSLSDWTSTQIRSQ
ncbi:NmrA/HSCARG family protein [Pontivivens ytuae]|uniref:NmrA/HSCARG family protein n=1 Tax=Pontivivens ytuae TaxID=2789856 RepID=A0A7S9LNB8_9RHOB|nr:NmrA/HSCARG family protein [Pontivivens ytuae]QPH52276.1 NmrA/HSCARG family protein [Pontivivens ytuae]